MRPGVALFAALCVSALLSPIALGNPAINHDSVVQREAAFRAIASGGAPEDPDSLIHLLAKHGVFGLDEETRTIFRDAMGAFEPYVLAAHDAMATYDWAFQHTLHEEFAAHASPSARSEMCSRIRKRIARAASLFACKEPSTLVSRDQMSSEPADPVQVLVAAEFLATYRDSLAKSLLAGMIAELAESPKNSCWSKCYEPLTWYLSNALGRIDDPDFRAIVRFDINGLPSVFPRPGDVTDTAIEAVPGPTGWRHLQMPGREALSFLSGLTAEWPRPDAEPPLIVATLRITLADSSKAYVVAWPKGTIGYQDNTRYPPYARELFNPGLASAILRLVQESADDVGDTRQIAR